MGWGGAQPATDCPSPESWGARLAPLFHRGDGAWRSSGSSRYLWGSSGGWGSPLTGRLPPSLWRMALAGTGATVAPGFLISRARASRNSSAGKGLAGSPCLGQREGPAPHSTLPITPRTSEQGITGTQHLRSEAEAGTAPLVDDTTWQGHCAYIHVHAPIPTWQTCIHASPAFQMGCGGGCGLGDWPRQAGCC